MNTKDETPEGVSWKDKKLLLRSAMVGLFFFGLLWWWAERAAPPEGHVFERLPPLSGIYKCCEAGGRYSRSWVGNQVVECRLFSFYQMSTPRNDCGLKEQLNRREVAVTQALIPTYWGPYPVVVKITSGGQTFYEKNDQRIRELWISGSRWDATFGFTLAMIFHFIQLIYLDRKFKKSTRSKA